MKLLELELKNFKGIGKFKLNANGNVYIYGDNATGKTTLYDAFLWLLFGKDSNNATNFEIKTLDEQGNVIHGLNHSVEAIIEIEKERLSLKKVYYEKWTKTRGQSQKNLSGHTTEHFIDGVPVQKKEYDAKIKEIADEKVFRLVTNPRFFNENLHWEDRRKILMEICGDVSDNEVIESDHRLSNLVDFLGKHSVEDAKKIALSKRKQLNREIERIPIRIDEATKNLPDIKEINFNEIEKAIQKLETLKAEKEKSLTQIGSGDWISRKEYELTKLKTSQMNLVAEFQEKKQKKVQQFYEEKNKKSEEFFKLKSNCDRCYCDMKELENSIEETEKVMSEKRESWERVNSGIFRLDQADICPTCGQEIPKEMLEEEKNKKLAEFNRAKSERLTDIRKQGIELKDRYQELQSRLKESTKEHASIKEEQSKVYLEIEEIDKKIKEIEGNNKLEGLEEYTDLGKKIGQIQKDIAEFQKDNRGEAKKVRKEISETINTILILQSDFAKKEQHEKGLARVKELEEAEKTLAKELEKVDASLFLIDEFTKTKVNLIEKTINTKFRTARFKLFEKQVNGGIRDVCETLYKGVPYNSNLNNASKVNVGLDIINTLSKFYKFKAPIFIDNAESITKIEDVDTQVIYLSVSEKDKKLRIEEEI